MEDAVLLAATRAGDTEAFARVLAAVQRGGGPAASFRAYLNTALRNGFYTDWRRDRRLEFTDDLSAYEVVTGLPDPALTELERRSAARAFARLRQMYHQEHEVGTLPR